MQERKQKTNYLLPIAFAMILVVSIVLGVLFIRNSLMKLMIFDDAVQTDCITEGEGGHKKKEQSPFSIHAKTGFVPADIKFFLPRFCCRGI